MPVRRIPRRIKMQVLQGKKPVVEEGGKRFQFEIGKVYERNRGTRPAVIKKFWSKEKNAWIVVEAEPIE